MVGVWLALGVGLAVLAQVLKAAGTFLGATFWLNVGAVVALTRGVRHTDAATGAPSNEAPVTAASRATRRTGLVLAVVGGAAATGCSLWLVRDWAGALFTVLLVGPLALLVLGLGLDLLCGYGDSWRVHPGAVTAALRRREVQLLLVVLAVAVVFRFGSLGDFPPPDGFESIEETQAGTGAQLILERGARPWEWPLSWYLTAGTFRLVGYSMGALRVPVIVMGCLTLVPFYVLVRALTAPPAALFATALLAVSRWHVQVSWYNDPVFTPLFPFVIVLALLVVGRRRPRPSYALVIGALTGYLLYDYAGFRVTVAIVAGFYAGELWQGRARRRDWAQLAVLAGVLLLFALPLIRIIAQLGIGAYVEAVNRSLADTDYYTHDPRSFVEQRLQRINLAADSFTLSDHGAFLETLNARQAPLLDPLTSVLFVLGFGTTLLQPRRRDHAFFTLAFLFVTFGATVLVQKLDFRRLAILIPFVYVFIAFLADALDAVAARHGRQRALRIGLVLLVGGAAAYNYDFIFRVLARDHTARGFHRDQYTIAAFYLQQDHRGEYVVLLTPAALNFFQSNDYDWIKPPNLEGEVAATDDRLLPILAAAPPQRDLLVLLERPSDIAAMMAQVRAAYPAARCAPRPDPDDQRWDLGVCRISAAARLGDSG